MEAAPTVAVVVALVSAAGSFFLALAETAVVSLSKWQARKLAEHSPGAGALVVRLLAAPEDLLATMVLGNTLANAAMLAVSLWMALSGRWPLGWTVAGLLLVTLIGGEVLPKTLAVRKPERWSLRVARPLALMHRLARPFHQAAQQVNLAILRAVAPFSPHAQPTFTRAALSTGGRAKSKFLSVNPKAQSCSTLRHPASGIQHRASRACSSAP